jgi:hypothetical protein
MRPSSFGVNKIILLYINLQSGLPPTPAKKYNIICSAYFAHVMCYCIMLPETAQTIPLYDAQKQASRGTNAVNHELIIYFISTIAIILVRASPISRRDV